MPTSLVAIPFTLPSSWNKTLAKNSQVKRLLLGCEGESENVSVRECILNTMVSIPEGKTEVVSFKLPHQWIQHTREGKRTRSYFSCSIARIYLHSQLFSLLTQPPDQVPQPHDVITMICHRQTFTQKNHTKKRSAADFYRWYNSP